MLPVDKRMVLWGAAFLDEFMDAKLPDLLLPTLLVERALARLLAGILTPAACSCSATPVHLLSVTRAESSCM